MFVNGLKLHFDEGGAGGGSASAPGQAVSGSSSNEGQASGELTFDKWLEGQEETVKGLLDGHTKGLKSALESERETRKGFEKQIRDLAAKAEEGSDAKKQLSEMSAQLELLERRANFAELASREGVTNPKALFTLAAAGDFFDKKGSVDFAELRKEYPEFFKKPIPDGNAGEGADGRVPAASMNEIIRKAAGRQN